MTTPKAPCESASSRSSKRKVALTLKRFETKARLLEALRLVSIRIKAKLALSYPLPFAVLRSKQRPFYGTRGAADKGMVISNA
jgi:hypothetical protein